MITLNLARSLVNEYTSPTDSNAAFSIPHEKIKVLIKTYIFL